MIHDLTGAWELREAEDVGLAPPPGKIAALGAETEGWMDARTPGCVHLDLIEANRIPDPFYGFNDQEAQWVAERHWLYRRTFDCPAELLEMKRIELVCEGLDTFATLALNGELVARADNMFRRWRWDVTHLLRQEDNELLVLFESPTKRGEALARADKSIPPPLFFPNRSYTRKAQYAFGWDWGPTLNTSGIWRPIFLEGYNTARIAELWARVDWDEPEAPLVHIEAEVHCLQPCNAALDAELLGNDSKHQTSTSGELTAGRNLIVSSFRMADPQLWWPATMGEQPLYELKVEMTIGDETLRARRTVGLRRVELKREEDEEGESFIFQINGEPVFCRGANWAPADSFLPRLTHGDYEDLLQKAADANMNMIRVWGGGVYESDEFYETCDRLGIMVWQDFMMACAAYPAHLEWFRDSLRAEARDVVRRLRHHPSIVLWCGNNECQQIFGDYFPGDPKQSPEFLWDKLLPAVCEELDPTRPYWPGSPYGGDNPNSTTHGDTHFWDMWARWQAPEAQRSHPSHFVSEFGLQGPPDLRTIRSYIPSSGHHVQSRVMEHHNRFVGGAERLLRYLAAQFRLPADFEDMVYLMQLTQGEAVKIGVDYWRSRKFRTAGTLFWQLNDCWPVISWSCLDYEHRPKALYYYARRFFAPALPVIQYENGRFGIRLVNDRREDFNGQLVYGAGRVGGDQLWTARQAVRIPANQVIDGPAKSEDELGMSDPTGEYFWCRLLTDDGDEIARDVRFTAPFKHVEFPVPQWDIKAESVDGRRHVVTLTSDCFAKGVWLRLKGVEGQLSENYFDALPELPVEVTIITDSDLPGDALHRHLEVSSVGSVRRQA
ncbi:MAG: glycoside hydrolase family 2 protein [Planctomycetes bacterium]|nr:glycoside hydrolase family 2 protein [Planctomycetota bacterium]